MKIMNIAVDGKVDGRRVTLRVPEQVDIDSLKVGDKAPDCFGKLVEVTDITYRGEDLKGRRFVGYYTKLGVDGRVSMSMKEGELVRTVDTSGIKSSDLDAYEAGMNQWPDSTEQVAHQDSMRP